MIRKFLFPVLLGLGLATYAQAQNKPLEVKVFSADESGFFVSSVLISGDKEAVLLDTQFTRANALRVAAMVIDSGKHLNTVYVSAADPDYYFGAEVIHQIFPDAKILASAETVEHIKSRLETKLKEWGPRLGENRPRVPVIPEVLNASSIMLEGQKLELVGYDNLKSAVQYVWIPSIKTIAGGVGSFAGVHVWTADTASKEQRAAWVKSFDAMLALQPAMVVPGHSRSGEKLDASQLRYTRDYLLKFEMEFDRTANSAALIDAMKKAYPNAGLGIALELGAKVAKGEMKW